MVIYQSRIFIKPVPYKVRTTVINGTPTVYTPDDYKYYKELLAYYVANEYKCQQFFRVYKLQLIFNLATEKYTSKNAGDLDNLSKGVLDALQGIIWKNDAQIIQLEVSKYPAMDYSILICVEGFN